MCRTRFEYTQRRVTQVILTQVSFLKEPIKVLHKYNFYGEFDPGSGRTLAACLTHASRTVWWLAPIL